MSKLNNLYKELNLHRELEKLIKKQKLAIEMQNKDNRKLAGLAGWSVDLEFGPNSKSAEEAAFHIGIEIDALRYKIKKLEEEAGV
ncbi:MAG: hypothetical protein HYW78_04765 [Parcubacteria group bacterium]|nr:hypothetical protein [Parcubacteria group bacterium]